MDALQLWTGQTDWVTKNLAYNLDFIPDDKLNWKPAPTANSALEIVHHMAEVFAHITATLRQTLKGEDSAPAAQAQMPTTREEAKQQLIKNGKDYIEFLQTVKLEDLQKIVESPFGKMPAWFLLGIPVTDAIHHHGQIAYIQTLLGDVEPHFDMSLMPS